jgi:predicted phosphodiesterase
MLIGIMSDIHDDIAQTKKSCNNVQSKERRARAACGRIISPFMIDTLKELKAPLTGVFGNNDGDRVLLERKSGQHPSMKITGTFARMDLGGMRIGLVHGNDRELLETLVACGSLDLLVVNPGEVYGHSTGRSTVALVDTGKRSAEIVDI